MVLGKKMIKRGTLKAGMITTWAVIMSHIPLQASYACMCPTCCGPAVPAVPALPVPVPAPAGPAPNDFSQIGANIVTSAEVVPGLLAGMSYMFGLMLGSTAVLKIKSHVENPLQTPIKDGAVRLLAGGALLAMPIVYESMFNTIGDTTAVVSSAPISSVAFNVQ